MKIAFIEPSILNVEPLGIAYLAQYLINEGYKVKYFETPRKNFIKKLKKFNPDILAYSITTGKHRTSRNINSTLRKSFPNAISLFGGPHCTFHPDFIKSSKLINGICIGEGELAMVELLNKIKNKKNYTKTANWWLKVNGKIYKNPVRERIKDLDSLPFPNREVIYAENKDIRNSPIKRIFVSRGCPFSCSYCFNKIYNDIYKNKGKICRQCSIENIIKEVNLIKKNYPITFLKIVDDTFGFNMDYEKFAELYKKGVGIPFLCNIRPNLIDDKKIKNLKQAGCVAVTMAVESGNEFIRNKILNRNLSENEMSKSCILIKKYGLRLYTQNIIGNPGETFEMALETFNFNIKNKVDFAECFLLTPFPGTEIYKYCIDNNYLEKGVDTDKLPRSYNNLYSCVRFNSKKEKNKLINFQKFFSFGVKHPKTLPLIKLLIKLPPNNLFVFFNRLYDAWRISRVIQAKFNVQNFITTARNNFQFITSYFIKKDLKS
ncbi:MAG: B12-binding domain-containing radical SAM protein [Nanoarchaeota archaeon]|nr:B12-binding domain-containing radical SAM protein [Nanoarchaeota archaeon]